MGHVWSWSLPDQLCMTLTTYTPSKNQTLNNQTTDRTNQQPHKGSTDVEPDSGAANAAINRCEELFAAIRLSRSLAHVDIASAGAIVSFPTVVVLDGTVYDVEATNSPGYFAEGHHTLLVRVVLDTMEVRGRFEISVGGSYGVSQAAWVGTNVFTGMNASIPDTIIAALPSSIAVPSAPSVAGAVRRAHLQAERARAELLQLNGGLVRSVVNRFRGVARAESALMDLNDLLAVGQQQLLAVADRYFTDPDKSPVRTVAWSKLVQRAIGNALRTEIARVTGISVEFRQLLNWCRTHPEDRDLPADVIARRMAFAAGVTRLMSARSIHDRQAAHELLEEMLENGEAQYVAPGREAGETSKELRADGVFVISSRSSLAEIERARHFAGTATPLFDAEADQDDRNVFLSVIDPGYEVADLLGAVRSVIERSGMTPVEAAVWLHRTGVLDPGGHGEELPDIAADLGLKDRSEARSALRRARRKIEAWAGDTQGILDDRP
ncbi:MAG: hypothetical protein K8R99_01165 [Actinomycetia bacterium]|nr:hypothetical protein [Actinomycetes bacterium]